MSHAVEVREGGGRCAEAWPALRDLGAEGRRALGLVAADALSAHRHVEELTALPPFVAFVFWGGARFGEELHGVAEAWGDGGGDGGADLCDMWADSEMYSRVW